VILLARTKAAHLTGDRPDRRAVALKAGFELCLGGWVCSPTPLAIRSFFRNAERLQ
jgi:hypothetical protein